MLYRLLPLLLLILPGVAHADWYEASTRHFLVYSDQRPERLQEYTANLERFDQAVRKLGGWRDEPVSAPNRVTVYVVGGRNVVARIMGDPNVAGFYRPRAGRALAVVPRRSGSGAETDLDAQAILLHEYSHHLMWSIAPHGVHPAWFVEGFAELFATAEFEKNGSVLLGSPPLYRARTLMSGNNLPLDKMLRADTLKLNDEQRDALYGRGWLLTHYFMIARKRPGQLSDYLTALNAGKPSPEAAAAFGDIRALDKELERYKNGKIIGYRIAPADAAKIDVQIRKLSAGEAATMDVRIRSRSGVNAKTAPGVYAEAQKAAAAFPNDAGAQVVLAEAAYDARDLPVALGAADRAIAADPKAIDGWVYKAMARMAQARSSRDRGKETLSEIRKIISKGNHVEPEDPRLLILYYRSFVDFGAPPTENARQGLARAFELAPQDTGLRFNAAKMFLRMGKKQDARAMLAPLAYSPHQRGLAAQAAALIAMIDQGDDKQTLKAIEEASDDDEDGEPPAPGNS